MAILAARFLRSISEIIALGVQAAILAGAIMFAGSGRAGAQPWYGDPIVTPTEYQLVDVQTGDLNGDGRADLVTGSIGSWVHHVFLAQPDGHMVHVQAVPGHQWARACSFALMDENQDGRPDLICPDSTAQNGLFRIWRNDGAGSFTDTGRRLRGYVPIATGDVDGDGLTDLLTAATPDSLYLYFGSTMGLAERPLALPVDLPGDPTGGYSVQDLRIADINGDGLGDFILVGSYPRLGQAVIRWNLGRGDRAFDSGHRCLGPNGYVYAIFDLADLDLDGDLDLCVTSIGFEWPGTSSFFRYQANGEFVFQGPAPRLGKPKFARVDDDEFWDLSINDGANVYFYRGPNFELVQALHVKDFGFGTVVTPAAADLICVSDDNPTPILVYPSVVRFPNSSVDSPAAAGQPMLRAIPGVSSSSVILSLEVGEPERGPIPGQFRIFDATGRSIRSLPAGDGSARWDLRDDGERPVPSGLYWVVLAERDGPIARNRIVVIR